jgi:PII-like signaling protein
MTKRVKFVRIYLSEADRVEGHSLMEEIFGCLHDQHKVRGVTVFRGIIGFGAPGEIHAANLLHLHADLPLTIEFFDAPEIIDQALAALGDLIRPEHYIMWEAEVA